jgi:hypothetical protein
MKASMKSTWRMCLVALSFLLLLFTSVSAVADEEDAKRIFKAMSDYLDSQEAIAFDYDSILEVVTVDDQKLQMAASGTLSMMRPDKFRATRTGGVADVEITFDGTTVTLFGKNMNLYAQEQIPGTIDNMVDTLRLEHGRPMPAADLLLSDSYKAMMHNVTDIKDIGVGVINGVACDTFAFRDDEVDWQIWIAQGDKPFPCRYVITTRDMTGAPQYSVQIRNWKTGSDAPKVDYTFKPTPEAAEIKLADLELDLPESFDKGDAK